MIRNDTEDDYQLVVRVGQTILKEVGAHQPNANIDMK